MGVVKHLCSVYFMILVCGHFSGILTSSCVEQPCTSCRNCGLQQSITGGPCNTQHSAIWPGPPSKFDIQVVYDFDARRDPTFSKLYPYLHITLKPPADSSIKDLKGFQIEGLNINRDTRVCLVKNLTGCELDMRNISQEFHFCIGSLYADTYFFLVHSLPAPGQGHLELNALHEYIKIQDGFPASKRNMHMWVTHLKYSPQNGTEDHSANVTVTFHVGKARDYALYFVRDPEESRTLVDKKEYFNLAQGQLKSETFVVTPCTGRYSIEIEPKNRDSSCICPEVRQYNCDLCPRTTTGEFILNNHDKICTDIAAPEKDLGTEPHSTGSYKGEKKTEGGETNTPVLITVVGSAIVVGFVAALALIFFLRISRKLRNEVPDMETLNNKYEYSNGHKMYSNGAVGGLHSDDSSADDAGHGAQDDLLRKGPRSVSQVLDVQKTDNGTEVSVFLPATIYKDCDSASRYLNNNQNNNIDKRISNSGMTQCDVTTMDDRTGETPLSSVSSGSYVPPGHNPNMPGGRNNGINSESLSSLP